MEAKQMITLKTFMETVDYKITEGSAYGWSCYGDNAFGLDSWKDHHENNSLSIVFDTKTQIVYEVSAHDYINDRAYRMINPNYVQAIEQEATNRGIDNKMAWDDVDWIDLDDDEDFLTKAQAIFKGEGYDTRVVVPLDLDDATLFQLMKLAHESDVTLNQKIEEMLREVITNLDKQLASDKD
jgi:hypothetical protein